MIRPDLDAIREDTLDIKDAEISYNDPVLDAIGYMVSVQVPLLIQYIQQLEAQLADAPNMSHFAALKSVAREAAKDQSDDLDRAIRYAEDIGAL